MNTVGIDKISCYTPQYYLDLVTLAQMRSVEVEKYYKGLGQYQMSILPLNEDIVTMAANAAHRLLDGHDLSHIDTVLFATESSLDQSKAAGMFVHQLLGLPHTCRVMEIKQACYAGTAALQMAVALVQQQPDRQVLVIASDYAFYGFNSTGESSQGAAAVAMLIKVNPRLLAIDKESAYYAKDVFDFWRPPYSEVPIVDGKYSLMVYLDVAKITWKAYCDKSGRGFLDHAQFCYHNSVPRLVEKAHQVIADLSHVDLPSDALEHYVQPSLRYSRQIGNCYTAALFLGIASMFDHYQGDLSHQRIGCYSYGSGCVGEFFSAVVQPGYQDVLDTDYHQTLVNTRQALTPKQYEHFGRFHEHDAEALASREIEQNNAGTFSLLRIERHKRIYHRTGS